MALIVDFLYVQIEPTCEYHRPAIVRALADIGTDRAIGALLSVAADAKRPEELRWLAGNELDRLAK
jgi:hypothetical protein